LTEASIISNFSGLPSLYPLQASLFGREALVVSDADLVREVLSTRTKDFEDRFVFKPFTAIIGNKGEVSRHAALSSLVLSAGHRAPSFRGCIASLDPTLREEDSTSVLTLPPHTPIPPGIIFANGLEWAHNRRLSNPAFHRSELLERSAQVVAREAQ
jgi:cytochrome P450